MPIGVLATGCGVEIKNGVNAVLGTNVDYSIEVFEAFGLQNSRVQIVFKVTVVECNANAVQPEFLEEGCIGVSEEIFEELYNIIR